MLLNRSDSWKFSIILLAICFWIFWNSWATWFLWRTVAPLYNPAETSFGAYYAAGQYWLTGRNPYVGLGFVYPPASLPFFGLFGLLNFNVAAPLWAVVSLSVFVLAFLAILLTLKGRERALFLSIGILLFLTSFPYQQELLFNQINLLVASISILSLVSQKIGRKFSSSLLLSAATLLKGPPILLLIYFVLFRRDLRYLAYFSISTVGMVGLSLLAVPVNLYQYYFTHIATSLSVASTASAGTNQSVLGYMSNVGLRYLTPIVSLACVGLFAFFAFYVSSKKFPYTPDKQNIRADAMFLMNILVMLLFVSRAWIQDYVWVILPLALVLSSLLILDVKLAYLALMGFETVLLNSNPLGFNGPLFVWYIYFNVSFPTILAGNLLMVLTLIFLYLCPNRVFAKNGSANSST